MDQPRKVAKPALGQLNREIKCPCRCIRGKYIYRYCCLHLFIYQVYLFFWNIYIRARFTVLLYKNQPGKVANPACGQLAEQGKWIIPCPRSRLRILSRDTGSAVPSRVGLLISILQTESCDYLRDASRSPLQRPFIIGAHYEI